MFIMFLETLAVAEEVASLVEEEVSVEAVLLAVGKIINLNK
jgi:hypothetical protein